jgi:DNA-binding GntR family transcriptional regulator
MAETSGTDGKRLRETMVAPRSVEESVTETLREAILRGDLLPGRRLAQVDLATELGVSRIPLRDALRRLEAEGLVEIDGRRGAHVTSLSATDIAEIYDMRILLEEECARRAVSQLSDEEAEELIRLSKIMDETASDPSEGALARRNFYSSLYAHAGLPRMRATVLQLRGLVQRYHLLNEAHLHRHAHEDLRESIRARDAEMAARVVRSHLEAARDDLIRSVKEEASSSDPSSS